MPSLLQRPGFAGSLGRIWEGSYIPDYIGLALVIVLDGLMQAFIEPFHRMFRIDDPAIQFPHAEIERVSVGWLFAYALGIPVVVFTIWGLTFQPSFHKIHVTYLGLFISISLTIFFTDIIKNAVGRPRPDLIARCRPRLHDPDNESDDILSTYKICKERDPHKLHDGWRSFPSGHSSFAFSGLGFLFFFFAAQFRAFHPATSLPTMLLTVSPLLGALLIALSRCEDYRHDVYDVTGGTTLGLLIAWISYRRYYPSITSPKCETPWPSKNDLVAPLSRWNSAMRPRDEESLLVSPAVGRDNADIRVPDILGSGSGGASGASDDELLERNTLSRTPTPRIGGANPLR